MKYPSLEFLEAVDALVAANKIFAAGQIKPLQHSDLREKYLSAALNAMAGDFGVKLNQPLQINSNGEYAVTALPKDINHDAGGFGQELSTVLNRHNPRTGVRPGATLLPENGWCYLNHFDAERMVFEYAEARQPKPEKPYKP